MALLGRIEVGAKSRGRNMRKRRNRLVIISFIALTVGLIYISFQSSVSALRPSAMSAKTPIFSLMVTAQFEAVEYKEQFLLDIAPVAKHVQSSEPETLAYEVLLSDKDPLQVLVLERYKDKENAYLTVHKSSAPFLTFREKLKSMQDKGQVTISGHSYLDSGVGFGDRA